MTDMKISYSLLIKKPVHKESYNRNNVYEAFLHLEKEGIKIGSKVKAAGQATTDIVRDISTTCNLMFKGGKIW